MAKTCTSFGQALALDEGKQLVVVGGDRRCCEFLALEVFDAVDARAIAYHQRLVGADEHQVEGLDVDPRHRRRKGAGAHVAHLHITEAIAASTSAPELNRRKSILKPVALSKSPLAMPSDEGRRGVSSHGHGFVGHLRQGAAGDECLRPVTCRAVCV